MADLDVVDENDNVIGRAPYEVIHTQGLRHRSVQVLVFREPDLETLLVSQRNQGMVSGGKFHTSAGGHVKLGQTYEQAALEELGEELFCNMRELPSGIVLVEVTRYKNDTRKTNKENTGLSYAVYDGPFSPDPEEIASIDWVSRHRIWQDMLLNPDKYTQTFINAILEFKKWRGKQYTI